MDRSVVITESEYEHLAAEVRRLRNRIIELTALRDDLLYHICPGLEARYEEKIGSVEREIFAAKLQLREMQRTIEILQTMLNRKAEPDYDEARKQAGQEFREYQEELRKQAEREKEKREQWARSSWKSHDEEEKRRGETGEPGNRIGSSEQETGPSEKESPSSEIKSLYRRIVKRLHPDVNPNPTKREKDLLNQAYRAYRAGDLEAMRRIWDELSGTDAPEETFEDTAEGIRKLRELLQRLERHCGELEEQIDGIRSSYPYTMKSFLEDEAAVADKRESLMGELEGIRAMNRELARHIEELRKQMDAKKASAGA